MDLGVDSGVDSGVVSESSCILISDRERDLDLDFLGAFFGGFLPLLLDRIRRGDGDLVRERLLGLGDGPYLFASFLSSATTSGRRGARPDTGA